VILQEIGQALDTPDDIIFDWLHEVSYPDQPFGRTILGRRNGSPRSRRRISKGLPASITAPTR
jgi:predicted Zn-dependent peptidase